METDKVLTYVIPVIVITLVALAICILHIMDMHEQQRQDLNDFIFGYWDGDEDWKRSVGLVS